MDFHQKKITVLGGQRSGIAIAKLSLTLGAQPRISDHSDISSMDQGALDWIKAEKIPLETGGHTEKFILDSDVLVLSPGVRRESEAARWADRAGIPVFGEIEFSYQFCHVPIIAVTGSNGKTTTATLIHRVLENAGLPSILCGNVGTPFAQCVPDLNGCSFVVLEVSSFQLESLLAPGTRLCLSKNKSGEIFRGFRPHVAVILNINQNHLDRHKDMDEYASAKFKIFMNQHRDDFAVLNAQDPRLKKFAGQIKSQVRFFNKSEGEGSSFDNPNYLAVQEVAKALGVPDKIVFQTIKEFKGVEHRLEWVREVNGVDYINDSKATTTDSGRWAIDHVDKPIIMICGGRDKNMDFTVLGDIVGKKVRKMIVIGEAREKLKKAFGDKIPVTECGSLEAAVTEAKKSATQGDCVLFTPMCTSFDMFKNFEERGRVYKRIVGELK